MDLRFLNPFRIFRAARAACLLLLAAGMLMPCAHAGEKQVKLKKESKRSEAREIESLETQWREALVKGDSSSMEKLLADDFLGISSNGTVSDKMQYLQRISKRQNQFSRIDLMDQKVRMRPTTAVVTSQARVIGQLDGHRIDGIFRYIKVYGRGSGGWRVLNFEATRVSGPRADETEMHRGVPMPQSLAPAH